MWQPRLCVMTLWQKTLYLNCPVDSRFAFKVIQPSFFSLQVDTFFSPGFPSSDLIIPSEFLYSSPYPFMWETTIFLPAPTSRL